MASTADGTLEVVIAKAELLIVTAVLAGVAEGQRVRGDEVVPRQLRPPVLAVQREADVIEVGPRVQRLHVPRKRAGEVPDHKKKRIKAKKARIPSLCLLSRRRSAESSYPLLPGTCTNCPQLGQGSTAGLLIVTAVLARAEDRAALVAVTVMDFSVALSGSVNKPLAEIVPPLADQVTALLLVLWTAAEN